MPRRVGLDSGAGLRATGLWPARPVGPLGCLVALPLVTLALVAAVALPLPGRMAGGPGLVQAQPRVPAPAAAEPAAPEPPPRPPLPAEAKPLLETDLDAWMAGVAALRANPRARDVLLQALANQPKSPRRWRLAHHLLEWGTPQDLPLVEQLLDEAEDPERKALAAAFEALYPRPLVPVDLARVVTEFVFVPQDAPRPYAPEAAGRWLVNDLAIQAYHQDGLPVRVIEHIMGLRGRSFDSRGAVAEAIQKQLAGRQWADFGNRLLAPLYPVPARLAQSGQLQVRLANPQARPLALVVTFQAWYGRFEEVPDTQYVLVPPGESVAREVPVRLIAPEEPGRPRVFLRVREANVPGAIEAQKLEVSLRRQPG